MKIDSKLRKYSFQQAVKEIDIATDWLSRFGLNYEPSRIGEYKRNLTELYRYHKEGKIDELIKKRPFLSIVNSVFEANELIVIYDGLSPIIKGTLVGKLQDFIKGPSTYPKEKTANSSNKARNIAFELTVASYLSLAGFEVDFGSEADMAVYIGNLKIFIECKRPQKIHQVKSNIKGAINQLNGRYKSSKDQSEVRGLFAISISKIVNPELKVLRSDSTESNNDTLRKIVNKFILDNRATWRHPDDNRTIGGIIQITTPSVINNLITSCQQTTITNSCNTNSPDYSIIKQIANTISDGNAIEVSDIR